MIKVVVALVALVIAGAIGAYLILVGIVVVRRVKPYLRASRAEGEGERSLWEDFRARIEDLSVPVPRRAWLAIATAAAGVVAVLASDLIDSGARQPGPSFQLSAMNSESVTASWYNAEYGRFTGGIVNAVTEEARIGTAAFGGAVTHWVDKASAKYFGSPDDGLLVVSVKDTSEVDWAGILPGDVIVEAGGIAFEDLEDVARFKLVYLTAKGRLTSDQALEIADSTTRNTLVKRKSASKPATNFKIRLYRRDRLITRKIHAFQ